MNWNTVGSMLPKSSEWLIVGVSLVLMCSPTGWVGTGRPIRSVACLNLWIEVMHDVHLRERQDCPILQLFYSSLSQPSLDFS